MSSSQRWRIHVQDMEVAIRIGIRPEEREPQPVCVSVLVEGSYPAKPGSIDDCFNYEHIYEFVAKWPAREHVDLLETYVGELLAHIFSADKRVEFARVIIGKPNRFPNTRFVGVEAEWTREDFERLKKS